MLCFALARCLVLSAATRQGATKARIFLALALLIGFCLYMVCLSALVINICGRLFIALALYGSHIVYIACFYSLLFYAVFNAYFYLTFFVCLISFILESYNR